MFDNLVSEMRQDIPNFPGPCYGMCLGDIAQNSPKTYTHYCKGLTTLGIPFFNVIGNHDHFHKEAETDEESTLPYEAVFGPRNYSFDAGKVHFVILDNCIYIKGLRLYPMVYGLEDEFLAWLKKDLALVPKDMPMMVCIHANVFSETHNAFPSMKSITLNTNMWRITDKDLVSFEEKRIQDYITRHALVSLGILKNIIDPDYDIYLEKKYLFGMLIGVLNNKNDLSIARETHDYVDSLGYYLDEEDLVDRVREVRLKCQRELFVLSIALDLLYNEKEEPYVVLAKVCQLL